MNRIVRILSIVSLVLCLAAPVLRFLGRLSEIRFRWGFLFCSIAYFVLASLWAQAPRKSS